MGEPGASGRGAGLSRRRLPERELERLLREGARLFDEGHFFESHEAWEHAWHGAGEAERDFFQGLIHAAAACLHHRRGNAYGYARQTEKMQRRLGLYVAHHRGVEVRSLLERVLALPPAGDKADYPRLVLDRSQTG